MVNPYSQHKIGLENNQMPRTRREVASFVIDSIKALGISLHSQSRLMRMHRVLSDACKESGGIIQPNHPEFEIALESLRDMQLLEFVFDQSESRCDDTEFRKLVTKVIKDSALPQRDRQQSMGRDAQFELFIAAVCNSAGLTDVLCEEPDVTCTLGGTKYGIAAKRIKSLKTISQRIREGANQIERARLPGVIALDTCVGLNRENERIITQMPDASFASCYRKALTVFLDDYHARICEWVRGKGVRGVVIHDHQVRMDADGRWSLASMTMPFHTPCQDQTYDPEFQVFIDMYLKGLPNVNRL
jgi:hypothetical protein